MYISEEDLELLRELSEIYAKLFSKLEDEELQEEFRRRKEGYLESHDLEEAHKLAAEMEQYNSKVIEFALIMFTNDLLTIMGSRFGVSDIVLNLARDAIKTIIEKRKRGVY